MLRYSDVFVELRGYVHNSAAKSCKDACQQQESAYHWGFGSIAQITDTAVELTLGGCALRCHFTAVIVVAVYSRETSLNKRFLGLRSFTIEFDTAYTRGCWTIKVNMSCSTVIPTLFRRTKVALEAVSYETKQIIFIQY